MIKEQIADIEWEMFQNVKNIGGRASCQDNKEMFYIMRLSQYAPWTEELLESYLADLIKAQRFERNMVAEKYARMMEYTFPEEYKAIADMLPPLSQEKEKLIDEIVSRETLWFEEYREKYPNLAKGNRAADYKGFDGTVTGAASMPVYLRGELRTYSLKTLKLYLEMVHDYDKKGINPGIIIMDDQMKRAGFKDIDDAERRIDHA